jgi:hypothetical protein
MATVIILLVFLAIGPLAVLYGADSRGIGMRDRRSWWPGAR